MMGTDGNDRCVPRREFLRVSSLMSVALALGCVRESSAAEIEAVIRKFILAVGPWRESQREEAEAFATRFLELRGGQFKARGATARILGDQAPYRSAPLALEDLDLSGNTSDEKMLLVDFVSEIYRLIDIHHVIAGMPPIGHCAGRVQYTRSPVEWTAPYSKSPAEPGPRSPCSWMSIWVSITLGL